MTQQYIDALESELRAAAARPLRLAAARLPRRSTGALAGTLSVVILCVAVAAAFLGVRARTSTRPRHAVSPVSLSSVLGPEAPGFRGVPPASAHAALAQAADAAAAGQDTPSLKDGEAWYSSAQTLQSVELFSSPEHPLPVIQASRRIVQKWFPAGGQETSLGLSLTFPYQDGTSGGTPSGAAGFGDWDSLRSPDLNRSSRAVLGSLNGRWSGFLGYTRGDKALLDVNSGPFTILARAAAMLGDEPLRPASRAAVFRALASLPHLRYLKHVRDPLGRPGVAVTETTSSVRAFAINGTQRYRLELIFNPATGTVLGDRTIAADAIPAIHVRAGAILFSWAYRLTRVVSAISAPPRDALSPAFRQAEKQNAAERQAIEAPGQPCHQLLGPGGSLQPPKAAATGPCARLLRTLDLQLRAAHDRAVVQAQLKLLTPPPAIR
jgi:hypothetical protein